MGPMDEKKLEFRILEDQLLTKNAMRGEEYMVVTCTVEGRAPARYSDGTSNDQSNTVCLLTDIGPTPLRNSV